MNSTAACTLAVEDCTPSPSKTQMDDAASPHKMPQQVQGQHVHLLTLKSTVSLCHIVVFLFEMCRSNILAINMILHFYVLMHFYAPSKIKNHSFNK